MSETLSLSVIVPIINEGRTIRSIVETLVTWGRATDIIIVDDEGSTDDTKGALKQFGASVVYLKSPKGKGKSEAMYLGMMKANGAWYLILDGDITNLTHADLDALLVPVVSGRADLAIGIPKFWNAQGVGPFNDVSGTRVFHKSLVAKHMQTLRKKGYGVEVFINGLCDSGRIARVHMRHVYVFNKWEKQTIPEAVEAYIREGRELLDAVIDVNSKSLAPKAKRALRGAYRYISRALDYFQ